MGVKACSRKGCDEIMCSTCIDDVEGVCYICGGCESAFKEHMEKFHTAEGYTRNEIIDELKKFMQTRHDTPYTVDAFFKEYHS